MAIYCKVVMFMIDTFTSWRYLIVRLVMILCVWPSLAQAGVNEYYSALAVHADTGEVLFDHQSGKKIYPASITKLMTLYLVFQSIEDGKLCLNDKVFISPVSAQQPTAKLGLKAGTRVHVRDLIMAMALISANDAAVALAEEVGGSVQGFVALMNRKAAMLKMNDTHFDNPTGLFHKAHYSTPRDVIILALSLKKRFPAYYRIFSQPMFFLQGLEYYNTNNMVRYFKNIDGLKTGYTAVSGYNLVCSFSYRDRSVFGAVFGFDYAMERDVYVKSLMEYAIKRVLHKASPNQKIIGSSMYDDFVHATEEVQPFLQRPVALGALSFNIMKRLFSMGGMVNKDTTVPGGADRQATWTRFTAMLHPVPRVRK